MSAGLRRYLPGFIALVLAFTFGFFMLPAQSSQAARDQLTQNYRFTSHALSTEDWSGTPLRKLQPDLNRISAWMSSLGAAVALYDVDGDGLPNDVCLVDPRFDTATLEPAPGTGQRYQPQILTPSGLQFDPKTTAPLGCAAGDFNEDGHTDLLVYYWGRSPVLFLRNPAVPLGNSNAFVAQDLVSPPQIWNTEAVNVVDVDSDGHPDIVVGNYFPDGARILDTTLAHDPAMHLQDSMSDSTNGAGDRVLLWQGATAGAHPSVRFREVPDALPKEAAGGWTIAIGAQDLNGGGRPDLYIANDYGPDRLLINNSTPGHLRFTLADGGQRDFVTPKSKVLGHDGFHSMGVNFPDLNGDGRPDIVVSNITADYGYQESNEVWLSTGQPAELDQGGAPYRDGSEPLGLARSGWAWDVKSGDFNNEGQPAILQAVGFICGTIDRWPQLQQFTGTYDPFLRNPRLWPDFGPGTDIAGHERNPFFVRAGDGQRFVNISGELGLPQPGVSRGIALADIDHDGRLDYAMANQWAPSYLMRNTTPNVGRFLGLRLLLPATTGSGTMPAIGASIRVTRADGKVLVDQVYPTNGHAGVSAPESLFGLGDSSAPVTAQIRWRDTTGALHTVTQTLGPGWHGLLLSSDGTAKEVTG